MTLNKNKNKKIGFTLQICQPLACWLSKPFSAVPLQILRGYISEAAGYVLSRSHPCRALLWHWRIGGIEKVGWFSPSFSAYNASLTVAEFLLWPQLSQKKKKAPCDFSFCWRILALGSSNTATFLCPSSLNVLVVSAVADLWVPSPSPVWLLNFVSIYITSFLD